MIDVIINLVIFSLTLFLVVWFARKDGKWEADRIRKAFRFFTCQSNVLCAVSALMTAAAQLAGSVPRWIWTIKYMGTAAVTVTMLTVFLFLAPSVGKDWYGVLLKRPRDLIMHLITPLLAIISFCSLEKQGMTFLQSLWGLVPVAVYGPHYLYRILYAPEGKRWDDFYGFNRQGKWPVAFSLMVLATFLLCMVFMLVCNA